MTSAELIHDNREFINHMQTILLIPYLQFCYCFLVIIMVRPVSLISYTHL